jgi:putative transposase
MQPVMTRRRRPYPSDLGDADWKMLEPSLPAGKAGGRHRGYAAREIIDAIQYLVGGGGAWPPLPHDLPHRQSVYQYFRSWRRDGTWLRAHDHPHEGVRGQKGA